MFLTAWLLWCLLLVEIYSSLKTCLTDSFFPQQDQGLLIFYFTLFFPKKVSQNACIFSNIGSQVCSIFQSDSLLEKILCSTRNKVYRASFIILMLLNVTPLVISYLEFKTFLRLTIIVHNFSFAFGQQRFINDYEGQNSQQFHGNINEKVFCGGLSETVGDGKLHVVSFYDKKT